MTSVPATSGSVLHGSNADSFGALLLSFAQAVPSFCWLLLSAILFGCGEYLSKKWALEPSLKGGIAVILVDAVGVTLWLPALLNRNQLSIVGVMWALLGTVVTLSIGLFIFKETLNWVQWIGIVFAFAALALLQK